MEFRRQVSAPVGGGVVVVLALLLLWARSDPSVSQGLAEIGINIGGSYETGAAMPATLGFRRQISGSTHGIGETEEVRRRFWVRGGQVLVVEYDVTVDRGRLWLYVEPLLPSGTLWERILTAEQGQAGEGQTVRIEIPRMGVYQVVMRQHRYSGSYDVGWRLE